MDFWKLPKKDLKVLARRLDRENEKFSPLLESIPIPEDLRNASSREIVAVFRSRYFLVQVYKEESDYMRLSINRTAVDVNRRRWLDGITWDDIQKIKSEVGFGDREAYEIYPKDEDVVDVANVRHIFVLPPGDGLSMTWRK